MFPDLIFSKFYYLKNIAMSYSGPLDIISESVIKVETSFTDCKLNTLGTCTAPIYDFSMSKSNFF